MNTVSRESLDSGMAIYTGERVAVVSPAIGGFRVWGYETQAQYMTGESHCSSMTVPYLTACALSEGYASGAFDLCNHCCEPVAWVEDGNNSAWVHLTPNPTCFYSHLWEGVTENEEGIKCEACALIEEDRDMTTEQATTASLCGDCQAYYGIGGK